MCANVNIYSRVYTLCEQPEASPLANALRRRLARLNRLDDWECLPVPGPYLVAQVSAALLCTLVV